MDNQDQTRTQTPGHESHGVHVCHKCGWPFPNPHPSAKHRRAHKKICGTIEGYKLSDNIHLNGSDDEHVSDDDHKTPGPNALDKGNNEKGNDGTGEKSIRSEDEVFADAVAEFSDSGSSPGIKEPLQEDNLDSSVEIIDIKEPKILGSSEDNDFNGEAADVNQLLVKSSNGCQLQNSNSLQIENVEVGNAVESPGQLPGSTMVPSSSSVADLRSEEAIIVHSDDLYGLSSDSLPSKTEAMVDKLPEKDNYAVENVTDCSLISVAKETNLAGKDDINSDGGVVEIVDSSDNVVVETSEGVSKIAVNDVVSLDHQVVDEAAYLQEKGVINSDRDVVEIVDSSDNVVVETHGVSKMAFGDVVTSDHQVSDGAANLKGKDEINSDGDIVEIVDSSDNVVVETCEGLSNTAVNDEVSLDHQVGDGSVNLKGKDVINSDRDPVDIVDSSKNVAVETCGVSKRTVNDVVSLDHQVGDGAVNLKGKDEINSDRDSVEIADSTDNVVVETHEGVSKTAANDVVSLDYQVGDGAVNLKNEDGAEFLSFPLQDNFPLKSNLAVTTNEAQVKSPDAVQFSTSNNVKILEEKGEENPNVDPLTSSDDKSDVAYLENEYEEFKDCEGLVSQNPLSLHSLESLKHEEEDLKDMVTEEKKFHSISSHLSEKSGILSRDMQVVDSSMKEELVNREPMPEEKYSEECTTSPVKFTAETSQRSDEIEASTSSAKTRMDENPVPSSNESYRDASFGSAVSETISVINIDNTSHHEKNRTETNDVAIDHQDIGANIENDIEIIFRDVQPSVLFQSEVEQLNDSLGSADVHSEVKESNESFKSGNAGEMGKTEPCDTCSPNSAGSHFEIPLISEVAIDGPERKSNGTECTNVDPLSGAREDKQDEININVKLKLNEEHNKSVGTSADSDQTQNEEPEPSMKAVQDLVRKYTLLSSAQDQSGHNLVKLNSSGIDASVGSGSRCDSLEGNWGSVSVLSMQSDAPAVTDEAGKSNLNNPKRQNSGKLEMFEPPSFMTLVEPKHGESPNAAASEGQNSQHSNSPLHAAWFPTLTQVANESQGRKKNEEIIAKVTSWSTSKEHTPLKSLLGEAASSNMPKSPRMEENSASKKNGKAPEYNGSGLTTVNSILGPESPASSQVVKGEVAKEWNSPARYPVDIKREKRKVKSKPFWIQFVCCSTVDPQRR